MSKVICHKRDCVFIRDRQCTLPEVILHTYPSEDEPAACISYEKKLDSYSIPDEDKS